MSGLVERLRFELRDWDGKSRTHFPSINALTIDEAAARIAALEAEVGAQKAALDRLTEVSSQMLTDYIARGNQLDAMEALVGPLDDVGAEMTTALHSEGIYVFGPDGERFERMFNAVMAERRAALEPKP